ncbi:serine/threonine-protein kinase [Dethiosulfatarculus sandiegensis]|uniref:Protein kinase domain-containing protein n=1 Tax=Dethiosulfatarculus sandiegensis TaxID=1429043 RepID=A0A0D2HXK2_9BACT|nr:serine/threonine-protein kinase [Dethiosulfatarculus sandiegensis]KIX15028.1 hypothetical protein X474_05645 [Dethiosulfatarculus sandiegensis]
MGKGFEDPKWKLGNRLGEGGQSHVYLATEKGKENSGSYALKKLKNTASDQAYARFYNEIDAVKQLDDPNIIKIVDYSEPDSAEHYYVMEYIEGAQSLDKVIFSDQNPYYKNALKALDLFEQICLALEACAHAGTPVVHRDICPQNILFLKDEKIKLIDFGLCQMENNNLITLVDEGVGTANYMAPECESGSVGYITARADLYSAAKVMWSAITGERAFARESPVFRHNSMNLKCNDEPATWHLCHLFEKTIRNDPNNRWGSAQEALSAIKKVRRIVRNGYLPLEEQSFTCPSCGFGDLEPFPGGPLLSGIKPPNIQAKRCPYCGICLVFDSEIISKNLESKRNLD